MKQATIDDASEGDEIDFVFKTKRNNSRMLVEGAEVVEVGGDHVIVSGSVAGISGEFALMGDDGQLKDVFQRREGQSDAFLGDRARRAN